MRSTKASMQDFENKINPLIEGLFTPAWSGIYDPATRNRWDVKSLLDKHLFKILCGYTKPTSNEAGELAKVGIADEVNYSLSDAFNWEAAGWSEALRHYLHTNLLAKLDYGTSEGWRADYSTMKEKIETCATPIKSKGYPFAIERVYLSSTPFAASLKSVSHPNGHSMLKSTNRANLSTPLVQTFGVKGKKTLMPSGGFNLKTSPSGGSRHPTEVYLVNFDITGLKKGVHHFESESSALELIYPGDFSELYTRKIFGLNRRLNFKPKAALVLTSIVERSMHRYRESRSYRVIHFDIGHLMQTLKLIARSQGIPFFIGYSVADSDSENLLGIDGLFETSVGQVLLG